MDQLISTQCTTFGQRAECMVDLFETHALDGPVIQVQLDKIIQINHSRLFLCFVVLREFDLG